MSRSTTGTPVDPTPVDTTRGASGEQKLPLGDETGNETVPFVRSTQKEFPNQLGEPSDLETRGPNGIEQPNQQELEEAESPRPKESVPVATAPTATLHTPLSRQKSSSSDPGYVYYNHPTTFEPDHACGMHMPELLPSCSENSLFVQGNIKYCSGGKDDIDYTTHPGLQARPKHKLPLRDKVTNSFQSFFQFLPQPHGPLRLPQVAHRRLKTDSDEKYNLLASGLVLYWNQGLSVGAAKRCGPEALFAVVQVDTGVFQFYLSDGYLGVCLHVKKFALFQKSNPPDGVTVFHFSGVTSQPCNMVSFTTKSQKFVWVATVDPRTDTGHVIIKAAEDVDAMDDVEVFSISQSTHCHT